MYYYVTCKTMLLNINVRRKDEEIFSNSSYFDYFQFDIAGSQVVTFEVNEKYIIEGDINNE